MSVGISFTLLSFFYNILLTTTYFIKKRIKSIETDLYKKLIIITLIGSFEGIFCYYGVKNYIQYPIFALLVSKGYLIFLSFWFSYLTLYVLYVAKIDIYKKEKEKFSKMKDKLLILNYTLLFLIFLLPINYISEGSSVYTSGPCVLCTYGFAVIYFLIWIVSVIKNAKRLTSKYIPVIVGIFLITVVVIIQKLNPSLLLVTSSLSFITFIMYFTIENPDMKMIEELEIARDAADKANRAKTDFLSSMSHEIRTPLNAIVGFSECIDTATNLDEAKEDAKDIVMASQNLLEIVNGILDISKIEADKMEIVNTEYNLKEMLENLVKLIKPRIGEKPVELKTDFAPDIPDYLYGDGGKIKQIITNLLTNAAKYTEEGEINFKVSCINQNGNSKLMFVVSDTGRGIKQDQIDKLFTKFQRLDEDKNTTVEGTGLGLAITKKLTEMLGGKITVQSKYGDGSTFTVYVQQKISTKDHVEDLPEEIVNIDLTGKKILVVDDNKLNLKVATKLLSEFKPTLECIDNGFDTIDKIKNGEVYDLILLDIMMPKMGGLETLKKLKEIEGFNIPVIALTADAIAGKSTKYIEAGFNDYLAKPMEKVEVKRVLHTFLDGNPVKEEVTVETKEKEETPTPVVEEGKTMDANYLKENDIDVDASLELLGDMETYDETLNDFLNENKDRIPNIEKYKNENDMNNYAILVHAMKSDSKYLGFKKLAELSYNHEMKSKENDSEYVNSNYDELMAEVNRITDIVNNYLGGKN